MSIGGADDLARGRRRGSQELVDRPGLTQLRDPDDLSDVQRVVVSDVEKHFRYGLVLFACDLREPIRRERVKDLAHSSRNVLPDL